MFRLKLNNFKNCIQSLRKCNVRHSTSSQETGSKEQKTALYDFHKKNKGKLINFGGYLLPVTYADQSIGASHLHTRQYASIFDVSHMLQTYVRGKDAIACFERICTADIRGSADGTASLTVFTNESGGILDDLIVTKIDDRTLYIVSNAAMKAQDKELMQSAVTEYKRNGKDVFIEFMETKDQSLVALQGPTASSILKKLVPAALDLDKLYFMKSIETNVTGIPNCRVTRCGYTGEDGFEISVASESVEKLTESLLSTSADGSCKLAGLGARDTLRLEAGLCLYASDIDKETTPVEAALSWVIAKRRRSELNFPGAKHIGDQLNNKESVQKMRVGLLSASGPPARHGVSLYQTENEVVGRITSGCPSPTLQSNIAMGYVKRELSKPGTALKIKIRNKFYDAEICRLPFLKQKYYMPNKK